MRNILLIGMLSLMMAFLGCERQSGPRAKAKRVTAQTAKKSVADRATLEILEIRKQYPLSRIVQEPDHSNYYIVVTDTRIYEIQMVGCGCFDKTVEIKAIKPLGEF